MSIQDINMVGQILLGITNPDNKIRAEATSKLNELSKNLGAISYCLLEISSYSTTTPEQLKIKEIALVILRYLFDKASPESWEKIDKNLQTNIKAKVLDIFKKEPNSRHRNKICEVLIQLSDIISSCDEQWEEYSKLVFSLFTYDPNNQEHLMQIESLIKLLKDSSSFLIDDLMKNFKVLLDYLNVIFKGNNIKLKVLSSELVNELLDYTEGEDENKKLAPFIECILKTTMECVDKNQEDDLKKILETIIETCSIEPKLFEKYFDDMSILGVKIINKKDFDDEKIRELAFEMIITMIEEIPKVIKKNKNNLKNLFELIYKYSLEMEGEMGPEWDNPPKINFDDVESFTEEKVTFSQSLIDRLVECLGLKITSPLLFEVINNLISNNTDWKYKYIGLYSLSSLSEYEEDMSTFEVTFNLIFSLTKNENKKIRYAAVNCINKFCDCYNPDFQKKYIQTVVPLVLELLQIEPILRIKCELTETLTSFIQFTTKENLMPFVPKLFDLLFRGVINENTHIMLQKSLFECLLEICCTIEEDCAPYAEKSFEIIYKMLMDNFNLKKNKILFGVLIELLTSIGPYNKVNYYKVIPNIFNILIQLVKGIETANEPIKYDLQNSIEKLLPEIDSSFNNLVPVLIECVLTLLKIKPKVGISNSENQINIEDIMKENNDEDDDENNKKNKKMELNSEETENYASTISLLYTIIDTLNERFIPYIEDTQNELLNIMKIKYSDKIRNKACKILPLLIKLITNNEDKINKGKIYINNVIELIEKEDDYNSRKKSFEHLQDLIDNAGQILQKEEANKLFEKLLFFFDLVEKKRLELENKKEKNKTDKTKKIRNADDDSDDEDISDLIDEDLEVIEDTISTISDVIGVLFKTHKPICDDMINVILTKLMPKLLRPEASTFETKMALYISDDMIEFLGMEKLSNIWKDLSNLLIKTVTDKDDSIRQAAAYGIGIFSQFTNPNCFDDYANNLINALFEAMKFKLDNKDDDESWGLAHDNIIAAFGKILNYQANSQSVKNNLKNLMDVWIRNLPIIYDTSEQEKQHEWLSNVVLLRMDIIEENLLPFAFKSLLKIYNSKSSNEVVNQKIEKIFGEIVKGNDKLKNIVEDIYKNGESKIKNKLESLIKK